MQHILIPPIPHLSFSKGMPYHLLLSHLVAKSPPYVNFYREEARRGSYLILDNSAHEYQTGQPIETLLSQAQTLGAREIVIPDALFDSEKTLEGCQRSLHHLLGSGDFMSGVFQPRLMFVAQGTCFTDLKSCAEKLLQEWSRYQSTFPEAFSTPPVLGLSKDYEIFPKGLRRCLEEIFFPSQEKYQCDIHLLGWGRRLWDLREIASLYGSRIRSVDSAKPFVYAISGIGLNVLDGPPPDYPKRSPTYFDTHLDMTQSRIASWNIEVFQAVSRGIL